MTLHGDCLDELKALPDNSVDLLCTDPPYGYSFMGKDWDKAVPSVEIWKECLRVLKPGAFAFIMSAPRSDVLSRMIVRIEDAGFRVDFTPIYWTYASGFPKAANIGKMVDKRLGAEREIIGRKGESRKGGGMQRSVINDDNWAPPEITDAITAPATPQAKTLDGSYGGFQPKPAVEVIIVAMKPLSEKTFVDQALKNGHGISWLDDCRIPTSEKMSTGFYPGEDAMGNAKGNSAQGERQSVENTQGRFPANLLVSDDVLNDGVKGRARGNIGNSKGGGGLYGHPATQNDFGAGDSGSYSRYFDLDAWYNKLHAQQPPSRSHILDHRSNRQSIKPLPDDLPTFPFLIVPKAAKSEKNPPGVNNTHATVKPLKLMSYLITLGSRPGDTVLDPFLGSGTTAIAAKQLGRNYIGIEREAEYVEIAKARLNAIHPTLL